jgi:hypothetical protein
MSYTAPVKDMLFVMKELAALEDIAKLRPCSKNRPNCAARCWRR